MFTCVNLILLKISVVSNFSWIKNTHENFNLKNFQNTVGQNVVSVQFIYY